MKLSNKGCKIRMFEKILIFVSGEKIKSDLPMMARSSTFTATSAFFLSSN